jgi:hypothetical protein
MLQDAYPEESERDDLEIAVFLQLLQDARDTDVEPLQEWLSHLDDECLLHYLPKSHHMFNGLREDTSIPEWLKTVEYIMDEDGIAETIGMN